MGTDTRRIMTIIKGEDKYFLNLKIDNFLKKKLRDKLVCTIYYLL